MNSITNKGFLSSLSKVTGKLASRTAMSNKLAANPHQILDCFATAFSQDQAVSDKAWWILEILYFKNPELVLPILIARLENINKINRESSLRPLSKIISHVCETYDLEEEQRRILIETCFSWLIGPHKVATKAHAMSALFYLGKVVPWVHPELLLTLEHHYPDSSAAYQARARMVFAQVAAYRKAQKTN